MSKFGIGDRAPWRDFPQVIRNDDLGTLKKEPEYEAAKSGDWDAALELVDKLLTGDTVTKIKELIGENKPKILPVLAIEESGRNKIPLAFATLLGMELGLDVETEIVQKDKVGRTNSKSDHRLAFNPTFTGKVEPGAKYLIVDDTLTMGGTIASLRGYVEKNGGEVVGASVMTAHPGALNLPVKQSKLNAIEAKHGTAVNDFWKEVFGYGIEELTQGEAGHINAAASLDSIRDRITTARNEGLKRLDESGTRKTLRSKGQAHSGLGSGLVSEAQGLESEQQAMIEGATTDQSYQEMLAMYVQAKHGQVDSIEDRLENLISQQQARLQQTQSRRPGFLSMPGSRSSWQSKQTQQQGRLQTLHNRLDTVREIKDGMGLHSPKIEELATRKMRAENPQLAADWDSMKQAERMHQARLKKEQEKKQTQEKNKGLSLGLNRPT